MLDLVMPGRLENFETPPNPLRSVDSLNPCEKIIIISVRIRS